MLVLDARSTEQKHSYQLHVESKYVNVKWLYLLNGMSSCYQPCTIMKRILWHLITSAICIYIFIFSIYIFTFHLPCILAYIYIYMGQYTGYVESKYIYLISTYAVYIYIYIFTFLLPCILAYICVYIGQYTG